MNGASKQVNQNPRPAFKVLSSFCLLYLQTRVKYTVYICLMIHYNPTSFILSWICLNISCISYFPTVSV